MHGFGFNDSIIHTTADGSISITGCTFANNVAPVNIAHKQAGTMEVIIQDSTFTGCGSRSTANDLNQYAAPSASSTTVPYPDRCC